MSGPLYRVLASLLVALACAAAVCAFGAPSAAALNSTPDRQVWVTNGAVRTTAVGPDGTIYVGGQFTYVGPLTGSGIAFDETNGASDLTFPLISDTVDRAVPDGAGGFYISGRFTNVGGVARNHIAHILADGSVDPAFDPDPNGTVSTVAVSQSTVYVGGSFTSIGGQTRCGLAAIDVTTGLATAWNPPIDEGAVWDIAVSGSIVYVLGNFTLAGEPTSRCLGAIDVTTGLVTPWNPEIGDSGACAGHAVYTLAASGSTVYLGGYFTHVNGQSRNNLAAVDATTGDVTSWNPNVNSYVFEFTLSGSTLYVAGLFTQVGASSRRMIAAVDTVTGVATAFNPHASEPWASGHVNALAVAGSTVYVGGDFGSIGGKPRWYLAALDATTGAATAWNPSPTCPTRAGDYESVSTIAVSGSTVYVGGDLVSIGGRPRNNIAALDASTGGATGWDPDARLNDPGRPHDRPSVTALSVSGTTVYAGGNFTSIGGQSRNRIAALDTSTGAATPWDPDPTNNVATNARPAVLTLAVSGSIVYAGGDFTSMGGETRRCIAALDATTGHATAWDPTSLGTVSTILVSGSTVYVAGGFCEIGRRYRDHIAALDATSGDATSWNPDSNGYVNALAISGPTVYAGGDFTSIGGQSRNHIAAVNVDTGLAGAWDPDANDTVRSMAVSDTTVYAAGDFSSIDGQTRNRLAAIDAASGEATAWNPNAFCRSTMIDPNGAVSVPTLVLSGQATIAGGGFATLGGEIHPYLARFSAPVSGSMTINDGAAITNGITVTIDSAVSGASLMRFRNVGGAWCAWGSYRATRTWTVPLGDGTKTVFGEYRTPPGDAMRLVATIDLHLIDTTPPVTTDDAPPDWRRTAVRVTLSPTDPGSGMIGGAAGTWYRLDAPAGWTKGTSVFAAAPADHSNDGVHLLEYRSADYSGNLEETKSCEVRLDTRAPAVTCSDDGSWHNAGVTVDLAASDALSGVAGVEYRLWPDVVWHQGDQVVLPGHSHVWRLSFRATDNAGNTSQAGVAVIKIDTLGPTTTSFIPLSVRKGRQVKVPYAVYDDLSTSLQASLQVTDRAGAVVKTVDLGRLRPNAWYVTSLLCDLRRGSYRYRVLATDLAGNPQTKAYGGTLRVR